MAVFTRVGTYSINTDLADVTDTSVTRTVIAVDTTHFRVNWGGGDVDDIYGTGFTYANGRVTGGTINRATETSGGALVSDFTGLSIAVSDMLNWAATGNTNAWLEAMLSGSDTLIGSTVADLVRARGGNDTMTGRGGNDVFDGQAGTDTSVYTGRFVDYKLTNNADGSIRVADLRAGAPDGTDTLISVENLQFSDKTVSTAAPPAAAPITIAFGNILRTGTSGANAAVINDLEAQVMAGTLTQAQATAQIVQLADNTTSVATLAYQFFTGRIPSAGGYDFLVATSGGNANNLNSAYYQNFNLENRYINFAVNLGKVGEGAASFNAAYGNRTLFDATKAAYATIFGGTPTDAKVTALLSGGRDAYFAVYGGDGLTGIGTKAAMVGWLMAEAVKADTGMYAQASNAFLTDLGDGATYNVDLVGVYGNPAFIVSG